MDQAVRLPGPIQEHRHGEADHEKVGIEIHTANRTRQARAATAAGDRETAGSAGDLSQKTLAFRTPVMLQVVTVTIRSTKPGRPAAPLTELHHRIMDLIWSRGRATAEQVRSALAPRHRLTDSSIRTLLRRLEARGYLRHELDGKSFVYVPVHGPRSVAARAVRQIIDRFCAGSAQEFLLGMVDEEVLAPEEIEQLAKRVRREQRRRKEKK